MNKRQDTANRIKDKQRKAGRINEKVQDRRGEETKETRNKRRENEIWRKGNKVEERDQTKQF